MRVLVIGGGGREHAVVKKLAQSPKVASIYALPGNAGMKEAELVPGNPMDRGEVVGAAMRLRIDFAVVTPDDPLAAGLVDALEEAGIPCFGPDQKAAQIEASKVFAKGLMRRYGIPTARWEAFDDLAQAMAYAKQGLFPLVVKADGLAKGKGVIIVDTYDEAAAALQDMMARKAFGDSGSRVVIEEMLEGPEVSVLCFADGETVVPMVSAMDHKRALDGDRGLNTGGMGAVAPNPYYTGDVAERAMREIFLPTVRGMAQEGRPFKGCLFFGLMLTKDGPKVLEYNARLGDPETQAVLPLMESDLMDAMLAVRHGALKDEQVVFSSRHACCVVLCSGGYPGAFKAGFPIDAGGVDALYAGAAMKDGRLVTAGGRVMGVTALGDTLRDAVRSAYDLAEKVRFEGMHFRRDIGAKALLAEENRHG
jgi:phosphoribosylamine--glycine ligase